MTKITEYRTPGTRLWWGNVREWCDCGYVLNRRRLSHKRNRDLETHAICMPLEMIDQIGNRKTSSPQSALSAFP